MPIPCSPKMPKLQSKTVARARYPEQFDQVSAQDVQGLDPRGPVSSIRQGDLPDGTTPDQRDILGLHHRNAPNFFPGWTAWGTRSTVCSVRRGYSVRKLLASS